MKISEILKEAIYGYDTVKIARKIIEKFLDKIIENPDKKLQGSITDLFSDQNKNNASIYFNYNPHDDYSQYATAEVVPSKKTKDIVLSLYLKPNDAELKGFDKNDIKDTYLQTLDHEVIHIFDLLRSGNKTNVSKQIKQHGSVSNYNKAIQNGQSQEALKAYFGNDLERNRLFNTLIRFLKKGYSEKIKNKADLIRYIEDADIEETAELFKNDDKLYRALILRLNREGVLNKDFK